MLDEKFKKQRAKAVRDLAEKADPFIKRRLLDLAARYESDIAPRPSQRLSTYNLPTKAMIQSND